MEARRVGTLLAGVATAALAARAVRRSRWRAWYRGKVVLVVGGTRGLGFGLARELAALGARVTIAGRDPETARRAGERLAAEGREVDSVACDARDENAVGALVARVEQRERAVDVLLNVEGVIEVGSVWDQRVADWRESIETHVFGPLYAMRAVLPAMRRRRQGRIANVASIGGLIGVPHLGPYAAGKFGLVGLSQAYAAEVAHDGISVTTVCPGLMRTGSPDNATFKGRTAAEYAWFTVSDASPLLSASTPHAVRTILRAVAHRTPFVTITPFARIAPIVNALAPVTTARLLALAARLLPPPLDDPQVVRRGEESHSPLAPSVLTALDRIAKRRYNQ